MFDSREEEEFAAWCTDAVEMGLIEALHYHPPSFELSPNVRVDEIKKLKTKLKPVNRHLLKPHRYQADFVFEPAFEFYNRGLCNLMRVSADGKIWVDVKGGWMRNTKQQEFSINQKWVYQKFCIYVNKVVPAKLFKNTWLPEFARVSPVKKQPVKKYMKGYRTRDEYTTND